MQKTLPFNPSAVLLTLRAARAASMQSEHGSALPQHRLPGLGVVWTDPDFRKDRWERHWSPECLAALRATLTEVLAAPASASGAVCGIPESGQVPASALPWVPHPHGMDPRTAEALLEQQKMGPAGWMVVPADPQAWAAWNRSALMAGLQLGASWWWTVPEGTGSWSAYTEALAHITPWVLSTPQFNQWIWPWSELAQQALMECFRDGSVSARSQMPTPGSPRGDWGKIKRALWKEWANAWGPSPRLEEWLAIVVLSAQQQGWTLQPHAP